MMTPSKKTLHPSYCIPYEAPGYSMTGFSDKYTAMQSAPYFSQATHSDSFSNWARINGFYFDPI